MKKLVPLFFLLTFSTFLSAQDSTKKPPVWKKYIDFHMYGRVGVSSSLDGKNAGSRLNLSGQAGIGGRLEENDYVELTPIFHLNELLGLKSFPVIDVQTTAQVFSGDNTYISNHTTINFMEMFLTVKDSLFSVPFEIWLGSKYYRSRTINMIDYWDFDNLSGPGVGIKLGHTEIALTHYLPYSNLNPSNPYKNIRFNFFKQHSIVSLKHKQFIGTKQDLYYLAEGHFSAIDSLSSTVYTNTKANDNGFVLGVQHHYKTAFHENYFSARVGSGIANGPDNDGWSSRTFVTYGNSNTHAQFKGAYGVNITESYLYSGSNKYNIEAYAVGRIAKGADNPVITDSSRSNYKWDVSFGTRPTIFLSNKIHLLLEYSFSMREYQEYSNSIIGVDPGLGTMNKFTIAPTYVPSGVKNQMARPHIRFVYAIALYNSVVRTYGLSQYYEGNNNGSVGHYLGVKSEWWF